MTTDHFSSLASQYARFRPTYPQALFEYLGQLSTGQTAWDCGTGNGQAAHGLTPWFPLIWASDISVAQLQECPAHPSIQPICCRAEQAPLTDDSVDLITVGQAWHWFNADAFEREAERVLRPRGYLAVWSYNLIRVTPTIDSIVHDYYYYRLGPFWPPERRIVEQGYPDFPCRMTDHPVPQFDMEQEWNLAELVGYLSSWSATKRYSEAMQENPLELVQQQLQAVWGAPEVKRKVRWPLLLKLARKGNS